MSRRLFILISVISVVCFPLLASDTSRPENNDVDQPGTVLDSEAEGIIPEGGLTVSTQPITPIEPLSEGDHYIKAFQELTLAEGLLEKGRMEAASDVSLQAYDDLMSIYIPRRNKKRKKLLADRHEAATTYITASLAYLEEYVNRGGWRSKVTQEAKARVGDLRDVSANYPELNKKVSAAMDRYTATPPKPTIETSTSTIVTSTPTVATSTPITH
jgi:hypothetical protein